MSASYKRSHITAGPRIELRLYVCPYVRRSTEHTITAAAHNTGCNSCSTPSNDHGTIFLHGPRKIVKIIHIIATFLFTGLDACRISNSDLNNRRTAKQTQKYSPMLRSLPETNSWVISCPLLCTTTLHFSCLLDGHQETYVGISTSSQPLVNYLGPRAKRVSLLTSTTTNLRYPRLPSDIMPLA